MEKAIKNTTFYEEYEDPTEDLPSIAYQQYGGNKIL